MQRCVMQYAPLTGYVTSVVGFGVASVRTMGYSADGVVVNYGRASTMLVTRTIDMTWLEYRRLVEWLYAEQVHYYDN